MAAGLYLSNFIRVIRVSGLSGHRIMTQCCIETISNRQEGSSEELKLTPLLFLYTLQGGSTISRIGGQPPWSPPAYTVLNGRFTLRRYTVYK